MKCIAYISRVVTRQSGARIPAGLAEIFRVARKTNIEYNITGILSYRGGHYIQVIEGSEAAVDQLYRNISLDPRHEKMTKILDVAISKRSFPDWNMKLLQSVNRDNHFVKFIEEHAKTLTLLDKDRRNLLKSFYTLDDRPSAIARTYDGKDLTLLAWPDFTVIKQSPVIIELCAQLTGKPCSYSILLESRKYGTQQQLDKILNKFEALGILKTSESLEQLARAGSQKVPNDFYSKMKQFLKLR